MAAREEPVAFESSGVVLKGVLHRPARPEVSAAMALVHGYFQSNRIGPMALYVQIARALARAGMACLRFDAAGFGESDGEYSDVSYQSLTLDLAKAVDVLSTLPGVDSSRIGVLGHSLGANIAVDVATSHPSIRILCLLAPNPTQVRADITIFTDNQLNELEGRGRTVRKGVLASQQVYEPINSGITWQKAALVRVPTLLVYGDDDPYYSGATYSRLAAAFYLSPSISHVPRADHNFLPLDCRNELFLQVCSWATAHFDRL